MVRRVPTAFPDTEQGARACLRKLADARAYRTLTREGMVWSPGSLAGTWRVSALAATPSAERAVALVYLAGHGDNLTNDFECDL